MDKEIQQILDIARKNGFSDESLNLIYMAYNQGLEHSSKMAYNNALDEVFKQEVDNERKIALFDQLSEENKQRIEQIHKETEQIRKETEQILQRTEQIRKETDQKITQIKYDAFMYQRNMIRLAIMPCRYSEFRFVPRAPEN
jgi:DNA anti-recombination protein RmuC